MPRARLIPYEIWKYPRIHTLSKDARILLIDIYSSVDDDGIVEAFPLLRVEAFDKSLLYELTGAGVIDILDEQNMIVFAEDHYSLNTFFKTQKYHPSKYRSLLFRKRPDIKDYFNAHCESELKHIDSKNSGSQIELLSSDSSVCDHRYLIDCCESIEIPASFTKKCLAEMAIHPEAQLSALQQFDLIKIIFDRVANYSGHIDNYEIYVKTAVANELSERKYFV